MKNIAADLFCGAGGTSTGLLQASAELGQEIQLLAINHWEIAIQTHSLNHPDVRHFNGDLKDLDPRVLIPDGRLRLLIASPECTHFSRARGGKPMSKQSRASVKYVLRWISALDVEDVLIENVPEFQEWGPLHRKGEKEGLPIRKLQDHGYRVAWRILNAANYGDATTRQRLFIIARKIKPIEFPEPTHFPHSVDMFGKHQSWRPAKEIIDWSVKGTSIFGRGDIIPQELPFLRQP